MKRLTPVFIFLPLLLVSCSVTQTVSLGSSYGALRGSSQTQISATDFFVGVVEDLSSWKANGNNDPVMDVAVSEFAQNVNNSQASSSVSFRKTGDNDYSGNFSFSDLEKLVSDLCLNNSSQNLITVRREGSRTRIKLLISLENWDTLTQVVPFLADRNFAVWGPVYNNPPHDYLTEEDYKELVAFILGEDGPDAIDASRITIRLNLPSEVKSTNGTIVSKNTVEFSFPLIDFLLLHNPIEFWCEF